MHVLGFNACVVDLFKDFLVADVVKDLVVPGVVDLLEDPTNLVLHLAVRSNSLVHLQYFSTDDDNDGNVENVSPVKLAPWCETAPPVSPSPSAPQGGS